VRPPRGLRNLFVSCHDPEERQFEGLGRLLRRVARVPGSHLCSWSGEGVDLSRRRVLARVLVSGHGGEGQPRFSRPGAAPLEPSALRLPPSCRLYLLGCGQGKPELLAAWAAGCGIPTTQVAGCPGETDTSVSTCLALHLLEEGPEALERWFPVWVRCNEELRRHFPAIRRAYAEHDADPVLTLRTLSRRLDLSAFTEYLSVIDRHPEYLQGLTDPVPRTR
jgi:hypothetical protein